jgi:hypothetical protein
VPFFEPPEPPEPPPPRPRRRQKRSPRPWSRPRDLLPGRLECDRVLARSDEVAIVVYGIACYPSGFALQLETVSRYEPVYEDGGELEPADHERATGDLYAARGSGRFGRGAPEGMLKFGVGYGGVGKATTLEPRDAGWPLSAGHGPGPHLYLGGGGGGDGDWSYEVWVAPLPPEAPVILACEWAAQRIPETLVEIDGALITRAAADARPVFPPWLECAPP